MNKLVGRYFDWWSNRINTKNGYLKLYHNKIHIGWAKDAERGRKIKYKVKWDTYYTTSNSITIPVFNDNNGITHYELNIM